MPAFSTYQRNTWLAATSAAGVWVSLHTAAPGDLGANEVVGGGYARQPITFGAPAGGAMSATDQPVVDVPAGTTVTHIGFWNAPSGGDFVGEGDPADETYTNDGTYTVLSADLTID